MQLCNFAVLQSGEAILKEIPPYLNHDFWYNFEKQILKITLPQKKGFMNQNDFIKISDLGIILLEKEFSTH